jgi:hypothetical protein
VKLEERGIPTVTICTEPFEVMATLQSSALKMDGLPLAIIPHPLAGRDDQWIASAAADIMDDVVAGLTANPVRGA